MNNKLNTLISNEELSTGKIKTKNNRKKPYDYDFSNSMNRTNYNMSSESVKGIQNETILSKEFFSPENVNLIQKMIIKGVFDASKGKYIIEKQNQDNLQIVMRSMYLQHARHFPDNIFGQIMELNSYVVDDSIPNILSEIDAQFGYLERTFSPLNVMDHPQNVSSAGLKTLPSVSNIWK